MNDNTYIKNLMGFYTEELENGDTLYFYQNQYTGHITELSEMGYYNRMEKVIRGANLVETISNN